MHNYWKADFFRVLTAKTVWAGFAVSFFVYACACLAIGGHSLSDLLTSLTLSLIIATISLGLGLFSAIYGQDIKAGALRIAIGRGLSRSRIILVKLVESFGFSLFFSALMTASYLYLPQLFGVKPSQALSDTALSTGYSLFLGIFIFTAIATIWLMGSQQALGASIIYVLFASSAVNTILSMIFGSKSVVTALHADLTNFLPGSTAKAIASWLAGVTAGFPTAQAVTFLAYLVVCVLISCRLFSHKELEF